jgi:hypothetical protein
MTRTKVFTSCFLLLVLATGALAQEQTASIQGTAMDASGAALPGVTVEAVNAKGQKYNTVSDRTGHYILPAVAPGIYTVTGTLSGMESKSVKDIRVTLGSSPKVDLKLGMSSVSASVTVTADAPLVDVTSSAASTSIRTETIEKLPRGRDFSSVVVQAPSANQNSKAGGISIDGATGAENRYIMDGVDTTNPQTGVQGKVLVTEFVEEVQVKSAGYAAEYGGATGGVINAVTKTGTNQFKGSLGVVYNNNSWNGQGAYLSGQDVVRGPILQLNLAGTNFEQFAPPKDNTKTVEPNFTIGGPALQDKLWFYLGYQPWIRSTDRTITFVPTQGGVTNTYSQDWKRNNYTANISGNATSKLLFKAAFNNSGTETTNLLPSTNGRGTPTTSLYAPDNKFTNWSASGYADFVASPEWFVSAHGGRFYRNNRDLGISTDVRTIFTQGSPNLFPGAPAGSPGQGYSNIPTNSASQKDAYTVDNGNFDVSWYPTFAGTHRFKAGYQINNINNEVLNGQQNYLVTAFWNQVCDFCQTKGTYGSAGVYIFQTTGNVKSLNRSLFLQDSWTTLNDRLTLNLGVRTDSEKVPSYSSIGVTGKYAVNFGYGDKLAPRLGFTYDLFNNSKTKLFGNYGVFYDIMKMEMPRGSFGGDKWIYWGMSLESLDYTKWNQCTNVTNDPSVKPSCPGMVLQSGTDLRHPSNAADLPLIDPNLKPMQSKEFNLGIQHELTTTQAVGFRFIKKNLVRAIEDVGVHNVHEDGSESEDFFIANPGEGVAQKILAASGCPTCPAMPKAKRDYLGYEFEYTKRWSNRWTLHGSYLYSKLTGNYSGLANSDEVTATPGTARTSPNVNRAFDSLFMLFDQAGRETSGVLGGDRPHQLKGQVAYTFPIGTTVGLNQYFYSGTPTTTEMRFQGAPIFPFGRNDMGRTPNIMQTDLNLQHDFQIAGRYGMTLGAIILNLFDAKKATAIYPIYSTTSIRLRDLSKCGADLSIAGCGPSANTPLIGGSTVNAAQSAGYFAGVDIVRQYQRQQALGSYVPDPRYGQPMSYQDPREVRVFARFTF